jgi:hypothetical protein
VTQPNKLGAASLGFFVLMFFGAQWDSSELVLVVSAFFAIVLGSVAGIQGNKWWLAIPGITAVLVGVMMWAGFTAT